MANSSSKKLRTSKKQSNQLKNRSPKANRQDNHQNPQKSQSSTIQEETKIVETKEPLKNLQQIKAERKKLTSLVVFTIAFAIFIGFPTGLLAGIKAGLIAGFLIPISILSYYYPRTALWAFLIYMPFGGTVIYWLADGNALFQLAKDVFYIPALIALVQECRKKRLPILIPKPLMVTLGIILFACLLTLITTNLIEQFARECSSFTSLRELHVIDANGNVALHSDGTPVAKLCKSGQPLLQGILGLKVLLGYVPLIFCAYYLIDNRQKLIWFGRVFLILAIICCSLGLAQYMLLKTGHCVGTRLLAGDDLYKANLGAKCLVGGALLYSPEYDAIRLPGTFPSPWHWKWFLVGNMAVCFTVAFSETKLVWRIAGLVGLGLVQLNAIVCGQRLAFMLVPGLFLLLIILTGKLADLKRFLPIAIGLGIIFFIFFSFVNPSFLQERFDSFVSRWNSSSPITFWQEQITLINRESDFKLFGNGLGRATNSTRAFGKVTLIETFHPKLLIEVGYPGLIAFLLFITHLLFLAFKSVQSLKDPYLRSVGSSLWVFILFIGYFPYWYPLDTDPVAVYFWLFAGIIFRLPFIERREKLVSIGNNISVPATKVGLKLGNRPHLNPSF